jgi:hypothetical protein
MAVDRVAAAIKKGAQQQQSTRPRRVPSAGDMDDETFFKHYNLRHLDDVHLAAPIHYHGTVSTGMIDTYRAYHERVHSTNPPNDHVHKEDGE